ncbi:MAG: T9SS type A sorting domain-containing protein [Calditrichota bacterium]
MKRSIVFALALATVAAVSLVQAQPFSALLSNFSTPLYDSCGNTVELPDGLTVEIIHDVDSDGLDWTDPLATVCDEPPECSTGPTGTVNLNSFLLNGQSWGMNGGMFFPPLAFTSIGDLPNPNRFYLRICIPSPNCTLYYIATQGHLNGGQLTDFSPPSGPSEWEFDTWTCETRPNCPPPMRVQGFTASNNECNRVILMWSAYTDTIMVDSLFITRDGTLIKAVDRSATIAYDSTMSLGQTHLYSIRARRRCGPYIVYSLWANAAGMAITPAAPTNVQASENLCQRVELTWSIATTVGVDSFIILRNDAVINRLPRAGAGPFSYSDNLDNSNRNNYSVIALSNLCGAGAAASDSGTALQHPPPQVSGVSATDQEYVGVIYVNWSDTDNETGYHIYRDGIFLTEADANETTVDIICTDLFWHLFQVSAINDCGEGTLSESDSGACNPEDAEDLEQNVLPTQFALYQNYPNPFNPQTTIVFDVPYTSEVSLRVFNTAGQQITVLYDGWVNAGRHIVQFNGQALPSGVFFGQLQSGEYTAQIKMLLLK